MRGLPWSVSAHAKDIWTSEPWEVAEKLADCAWARDLHRHGRCSACAAWRRGRTRCSSSITASTSPHLPRAGASAAAARRQRCRRSRRHPVDRPQGREEGIRRSSGRAGPAAARRCTGASSISAAASCGDALKAQAARARHRRALHLARRPAAEAGVRRPRARRPVRAGEQEGGRRRPGRLAQRADGSGPPGPRHRLDPCRGDRRVHRGRRQRTAGAARRARGAGRRARAPGARSRPAPAVRASRAAETVRTRFSFDAGVDWIASALGQVPSCRRQSAAE